MKCNADFTGKGHDSLIETVWFGICLAFIGGFLDAYTFITRDGVFANAQTGNVVLIGVYASYGKLHESVKLVPPVMAFIAGVFVSGLVKDTSAKIFKRHWAAVILAFEAVILGIIGFLPLTAPDKAVTVAISFIASVQVSSFRTLTGRTLTGMPYSTTMITGNLRSAADAAYIAIRKKDRVSMVRALSYTAIIAAFTLGALGGSIIIQLFSVKSIWLPAFMLLSLCIILIPHRRTC